MSRTVVTAPARRPRVVVAVCTYRRASPLAALLPLLVDQAAAIATDGVDACVVVVDNDPEGSARPVVAARPGVAYVHQPRPGIAASRNAALDAATGHDALVFVDDDDRPAPGWLADLVAAWRFWGSAAVAGPSVPVFTAPVSPWIAGSGAFRRRRHRDGTLVRGAATHNLLLDVADVARRGVRFDETLGLTGGEDTVFTHTLVARGGEIRWCDTAEVVRPVGPERLTRRWVLTRSLRAGTTWSAMELSIAQGRTAPLRGLLVAKAVANTALAVPLVVRSSITADVGARAAVVCRITAQVGLAYGACGGRVHEYRRPRGVPTPSTPSPSS